MGRAVWPAWNALTPPLSRSTGRGSKAGERAFGNRVVRVDSQVEARSHLERNTAMMRPSRRLMGSVVTVVALLIGIVTGGCAGAQEAAKAAGNPMIVYVGTYTGPKSK